MAEKTSPLTEDDLKAIVLSEITNSVGYLAGSGIVEEREKNLDYYLMRPRGDEREGYSRVQSSDVFDTTESMLPGLVKIFTGSDEIVSFAPMQEADVEIAKQQTEGVNYVVTKENPWFNICYTFLKDGLLQKNGVLKVFWEDDEKVTYETYKGITDQEFLMLTEPEGGDELEITGHESYMMVNGVPAQAPDPDVNDPSGILSSGLLHDVEIKRTSKRGKARIVNVAPEHFIISRGATSICEARFTGHKERKTISELREMGIPEERLDRLSGSTEIDSSNEEYARWQDQDQMRDLVSSAPLDESMRVVETVEGYVQADMDGDGVAELHRVLIGGNIILQTELWDENPFEAWTPIPLPHQFFGLAIADVVRPTQDIKTAIKRNMLDNFYTMNNSGFIVDRNSEADLDALINRVPGGVVLTESMDGVRQMDAHPLPNTAFDLLELETAANESRTGQTRYNQGLDADSLNKTATGASIIQSAAQQRLELVARLASTSIENVFCKVSKLMKKHQDKAKMVRLRDKWIPIDPRTWNDEFDATISVGMSANSKEMDMQRYMNALAAAERVFPLGIVGVEGVAKLVSKLFEASGIKSVDEIVKDPSQQPPQPQQDKPDPEMAKLQAQMQMEEKKLGFEQQKTAAQLQLEREKIVGQTQADLQKHAMTLESNKQIAFVKTQAESQFRKEMADATAKPTTQLQISGEEVLSQVAQTLQGMAVDQSQAMLAGVEAMTMAANAIAVAVQQMNAPKVGTLSNGKTITIQSAAQ